MNGWMSGCMDTVLRQFQAEPVGPRCVRPKKTGTCWPACGHSRCVTRRDGCDGGEGSGKVHNVSVNAQPGKGMHGPGRPPLRAQPALKKKATLAVTNANTRKQPTPGPHPSHTPLPTPGRKSAHIRHARVKRPSNIKLNHGRQR
eukprot:364020-Chlamydomonas_euryale.AAC.7